jgi:hypothetical protein
MMLGQYSRYLDDPEISVESATSGHARPRH